MGTATKIIIFVTLLTLIYFVIEASGTTDNVGIAVLFVIMIIGGIVARRL